MKTTGAEATVVKRATGAARRASLAAEAAVLQALSHPGVARFVDYRPGDHHDELETQLAGSVTLADLPPRDLAAAAGILAGVGGIVADLHASGVAHGAIAADHIIVGSHRHPVLCSFGATSRDVDAQRHDVVALGQLAESLANGLADRGRRQLRNFRSIAAAASAGEIDALEFARRCAAVPDANVPAPDEAAPTVPIARPAPAAAGGTRAWRHRIGPVAAVPELGRNARIGALVAVAALTGLLAWAGLSGGERAPALAVTEPTPDVAVGVRSVDKPAASVTPTSAPVPSCAPRPDVDGDGCADDVEVIGATIRVGDQWFAAGRAGDVVAVGHWDCAAVATPAVLRPSTGEMFVFDAWPVGEAVASTSPTQVVPGAVTLDVDDRDGCRVPIAVGGDV